MPNKPQNNITLVPLDGTETPPFIAVSAANEMGNYFVVNVTDFALNPDFIRGKIVASTTPKSPFYGVGKTFASFTDARLWARLSPKP